MPDCLQSMIGSKCRGEIDSAVCLEAIGESVSARRHLACGGVSCNVKMITCGAASNGGTNLDTTVSNINRYRYEYSRM